MFTLSSKKTYTSLIGYQRVQDAFVSNRWVYKSGSHTMGAKILIFQIIGTLKPINIKEGIFSILGNHFKHLW